MLRSATKTLPAGVAATEFLTAGASTEAALSMQICQEQAASHDAKPVGAHVGDHHPLNAAALECDPTDSAWASFP